MPDLISVVMPTYNPDAQIGAALNSIFQQRLPHGVELEVIVVDDGSEFGLDELLRPFLQRVKLIRQDNQGVSAARDTGLDHACGNYIAFLDDDDTWVEDSLSRRFHKLKELNAKALVSMPFHRVTAEGELEPRLILKELGIGDARPLSFAEFYDHSRLCGYFVLQGFLGRTDLLRGIGGFDRRLFANEDVDLLGRLMLEETLYFYKYPTFVRTTSNLTSDPRRRGRMLEAVYLSAAKQLDIYRTWSKRDRRAFVRYFDTAVRHNIKHMDPKREESSIVQLRSTLIDRTSPKNLAFIFWTHLRQKRS